MVSYWLSNQLFMCLFRKHSANYETRDKMEALEMPLIQKLKNSVQ